MIKENHDLVRTWSSGFDATTELFRDSYLVKADGPEKRVEADVMIKTEATHTFHFDCKRRSIT